MQVEVENERVYVTSLGNVPVFGLAYPSIFVLGRDHRVKWRFVSEGPELRYTGAAILEKSVEVVADGSRTAMGSRNIEVTSTNTTVGSGNRIRISVELRMPEGFHVYSPEVGGDYIGVSWQMDPTSCLEMGETLYPEGAWKLMKSTSETLPVYEGVVRMSREVIITTGSQTIEATRVRPRVVLYVR